MTAENRQEWINDWRAFLTWLEDHPEVELPYDMTSRVNFFAGGDKDAFAAIVKAFGECEKDYNALLGDDVSAKRHLGRIELFAVADKDAVCEKVVVGTEDIPETVIPASPEKVIAAHTREIVEWRCGPFLADAAKA